MFYTLHSCRVPRLLPAGHAEEPAAGAGTGTDATSGHRGTHSDADAGRDVSHYGWATFGDAALHATDTGTEALATPAPTHPARSAAPANSGHARNLPRRHAPFVGQTFCMPLLKRKHLSRFAALSCESQAKGHPLAQERHDTKSKSKVG